MGVVDTLGHSIPKGLSLIAVATRFMVREFCKLGICLSFASYFLQVLHIIFAILLQAEDLHLSLSYAGKTFLNLCKE